MSFLDKLQTRVKQQADSVKEQTMRLIATTSSDIQSERIEICNSCDRLTKRARQCKECGCFVDLKTWLGDQECPLGKWHKVT